MSRYILDTDCFSLYQNQHPEMVRRVKDVDKSEWFVTIITLEEQLRGRLAVINRVAAHHPEKLPGAYALLHKTQAYFCEVNLLDFDERSRVCYQELRQRKIRIGTHDLRIAAIALTHQSTLITRNQKDFTKVSTLSTDDWSVKLLN